MGIDIGLTGRFTSKVHRGGASSAEAIHRFAEEWWGDDLLGADLVPRGPEVQIHLLAHPTAEAIEIVVRRSALEAGARTNSVGPGYHERVCDFLHHLEAVAGIEWDSDPDQDDTGYFTSGNRAALESEMLGWLGGLCTTLLQHLEGEEEGGIGLCMPLEPSFLYPAQVRTPTGPRTLDWVRQVAADPASGRDFFSSWRGDRSAPELLNRARAHMWMDLYWVVPQSEFADETMNTVADLLAEAYRSDPSLDYPWAEWAEILGLLDRNDDALASVVRTQAEGLSPTIGYRRHPVRFSALPGPWSIALPGRFASEWEDEETWLATDGESVLRINTMEFTVGSEEPDPREMLESEGATVHDSWMADDGRRGASSVSREEEDGEEYWMIRSLVIKGLHMAHLTVATEDPDQPWILKAVRSAELSEPAE